MKLSAFQLKIIALATMTLDHFAVYVWDGPGFRTIGRIAAVLFLFLLVESFRHTRSKKAFLLRLFLANVLMVPLTALFNLLLYGLECPFHLGTPKIFGTLFLVALFLALVEKMVESLRAKNHRGFAKYSILTMAAILLPILLFYGLYEGTPLLPMLAAIDSDTSVILVEAFLGLLTVVPNVITMEYSFVFILLGLCWYFWPKRKWQLLIFALFCALSYLGSHYVERSALWPMTDFFEYEQFWMILALPFMALYSGARGPRIKYFFYAYYPLHIYALALFGWVLRG